MKKFLRYFLIVFLLIVVLLPAIYLGPYYMQVQHFAPQPEKGFHADFFLYISPKAKEQAAKGKPVVLLIQPNNSGNSDDPEFHKDDAWWMGFGRHGLADELGVALMVPAFVRPSTDWKVYTHALDRDVFTTENHNYYRPDLQLLAMVEEARLTLKKEGFETRDQFLVQGYSASGMFANRFAVLHPEHVLAVAVGSPGGWPIAPVEEYEGQRLVYPAGIADLDSIAGKAFDPESYRNIPQLIVMGDLDDNDSLDFSDGWDEAHADLVERLFGEKPLDRWEDSKKLYQLAGANVDFQLVGGVGHDRRALQHLSTAFFEKVLLKK